MKQLLTAIVFLSITSFASAQIVNITSQPLKSELINYTAGPVIDTNGDGEIQLSEALAVHRLYLQAGVSDDLTGLEAFTNIDTLTLYTWPLVLSHLNLSGWTWLRTLYCDSHNLQSVNLSGCSNLSHVEINGYTPYPYVYINSIDLSGTPRLKDFMCNDIVMPDLDLRQQDSLVNLTSYWRNDIGIVNVSGLTMCKKVALSGHVGLINAENATGLNIISIGSGGSGDTLPIDSINVHGCTNLYNLSIGTDYSASAIDLSTNVNLGGFSGGSSTLTSLDFSNCNRPLHISGTFGNLHNLNIKNGHTDLLYISSSITPSPHLYVCTDDFETTSIDSTLYVRDWTLANTVINPFCSIFANGGTYNVIAGTVRLDRDHNGCDNADSLVQHIPVKITNAQGNSVIKYTSNPPGEYRYYDTTGSFTVKPYFPYQYYTTSPATANVVFNTVNNITDINDFCIAPNGNHNQLDITVIPYGNNARPGFTNSYKIYYRNRGTTTLSGNVQFNFDNGKMVYFGAWPTENSQVPGQLTWNYSNLEPFQAGSLDVAFTMLPMPVNNSGDTLMFLATINPVAGDEIQSDNSFVLPQLVRASCDPNDKMCLQGDKLDITKIGSTLDYVIHFQNLGTDTAFNVVVTDTLTNNVDWESFEITGTSHPCEVQRKDNKLQFYFKDIHLPWLAINEPASHGFIAFKIKSKNTLTIGDSVNNRASIYFDFNPAVVTNMATTIVSPTSNVAVKLEYFSLSTKNETNLLTWRSPSTSGTSYFGIERSNDGIHFSNFGNITASVDRCQLPFNFTDEKPFDGKTYYRLNIKDADGNSFYSKVLVAGRTRSGFSINAVVSDRNNTTIYLNASKEQNLQMKIIATDGRLLYNQNKTIEAGNSTLNLPLKNLAIGIYTLIVYTSEGEVITKRFVK